MDKLTKLRLVNMGLRGEHGSLTICGDVRSKVQYICVRSSGVHLKSCCYCRLPLSFMIVRMNPIISIATHALSPSEHEKHPEQRVEIPDQSSFARLQGPSLSNSLGQLETVLISSSTGDGSGIEARGGDCSR